MPKLLLLALWSCSSHNSAHQEAPIKGDKRPGTVAFWRDWFLEMEGKTVFKLRTTKINLKLLLVNEVMELHN